mmetsp:Transcript_123648/g.384999  ORF Transcript_123648/g.384999 Transcript_123648/m.384999 type:complete len:202 (-) Transcript_123648:6-611(-)
MKPLCPPVHRWSPTSGRPSCRLAACTKSRNSVLTRTRATSARHPSHRSSSARHSEVVEPVPRALKLLEVGCHLCLQSVSSIEARTVKLAGEIVVAGHPPGEEPLGRRRVLVEAAVNAVAARVEHLRPFSWRGQPVAHRQQLVLCGAAAVFAQHRQGLGAGERGGGALRGGAGAGGGPQIGHRLRPRGGEEAAGATAARGGG